MDQRILLEKSFDNQVEDTIEEAWELDAETPPVDQKKTDHVSLGMLLSKLDIYNLCLV